MFCGIVIALIPFFKISKFLIIPQVFLCLFFLIKSEKLFSTWKDKKIKYKILFEKNKNEFRPDSFKIFMQAPCGRLLTKLVLKDLGLSDKYKELKKYKPSFISLVKNNCTTQKTKIYINENFK